MYDSTSTSHEELYNKEYTPRAQHLGNSPVTKISSTNGLFPQITGAEAAFNELCEQLKGPVQMVLKKDITWSKKDLMRIMRTDRVYYKFFLIYSSLHNLCNILA